MAAEERAAVTVKRIHIKNFKSIVDLKLYLGDVNVFIGENGSGKSNILEAIAFGSAAAADKLDNEFLVSRGIRVADVRFMRSAFGSDVSEPILVDFAESKVQQLTIEIFADSSSPYPRWETTWKRQPPTEAIFDNEKVKIPLELLDHYRAVREFLMASDAAHAARIATTESPTPYLNEAELADIASRLQKDLRHISGAPFSGFVIYSPENSALRTFEQEGQLVPLGIHGEGLLKLLRVLAAEDSTAWESLRDNLRLLDWFSEIELELEHKASASEQPIRLRDRFLPGAQPAFDQRSANEGFLYLLFFFALVLSRRTPNFFAIENVDTSLNPKACSELMQRLAALSIERGKQVLLTTHNPSLLDGLNLHDDRQRLFVVSRNRDGHTIARRIEAPKPVGNELPIRLSEAFTRGLLGGLPRNF